MEESSTSMGELLGGIVVLSTIGSLLLSFRVPSARIAAGLLVVGLAIAYAAVGIWRLADGRHVNVVPWIVFVSCSVAAGVLLFRWGRRTTAS